MAGERADFWNGRMNDDDREKAIAEAVHRFENRDAHDAQQKDTNDGRTI